jgi:hypothetical protein
MVDYYSDSGPCEVERVGNENEINVSYIQKQRNGDPPGDIKSLTVT